jgi:hypothetical protein
VRLVKSHHQQTNQSISTRKDNTAFAVAIAAAAMSLVALFANNANADVETASSVQTLETIVVTAPRIHTVQLETIVVTAQRNTGNLNADNIIVAAK